MDALEVAQYYFDAWNRRDAPALAAAFSRGGTYRDPFGGPSLPGEALAAFARSLWEAFPDLSFELVHAAETVAAEWLLHGTQTGWGPEVAPTGRVIALPGRDFIEVEGDKIRSVEAHFDPRTVPTQLGLFD